MLKFSVEIGEFQHCWELWAATNIEYLNNVGVASLKFFVNSLNFNTVDRQKSSLNNVEIFGEKAPSIMLKYLTSAEISTSEKIVGKQCRKLSPKKFAGKCRWSAAAMGGRRRRRRVGGTW